MSQARPIRWHDLRLIYRLIGHGASFDSQFSVTVGEDGLRYNLFNFLSDIHAFIVREPHQGLGVLTYPQGALYAGLAYMAPTLESSLAVPLWQDLLDGMTASAGQDGIVALRAEVDEHDYNVFETFRHCDFGVYARQTLWEGLIPPRGQDSDGSLHRADPLEIRAAMDAWNARLPGLVRQANMLPEESSECYLLDERHSPPGLAAVHRGPHQVLVDLFLSLEGADQAEATIHSLLDTIGKPACKVVVRVRHDMEWLGNPLSQVGFEYLGSQVVMIRYTLAHVRRYSFRALPAKPGTIPTAGILPWLSPEELTSSEEPQPVIV